MKHTPARSRVLASAAVSVSSLLAIALVASCGTPAETTDPTAGATVEQARLSEFYQQELNFGGCAGFGTTGTDEATVTARPDFQCARMTVPLDYTAPQGATADIAVLKVPARGEKIGSLLLNPGGPGGAGVPMAAAAAKTWADSPLSERFDLVGFDPRGVGASTPAIDCYSEEENNRGVATTTATVGLGTVTEADSRALLQRCADRSGGENVLKAMSTRNTVRDLDVLRQAVGDEKLTFLGQSYGTRLGSVYAEMFPNRVRALVLDGAIDPTLNTSERRLIQWQGFARSFQELAAACAQQVDCPLGADPAKASEEFQKLARPLIDDPIPAGERGTFGFNEAYGSVVAGLYYAQVWPVIIDGLRELRERKFATLQKIGDTFSGRGADGKFANFGEAVFAINCMDEDRHSPHQESDLKRRIAQIAPFTDAGRGVETRDPCEFWPGEPTLGYPYAQNITGLPATLVISVTGDPATTHAGGIALAQSLGSALLTVRGEQHTVAFSGKNTCVNGVVADYLVNLRTPKADAECVL